MAAATPGPESSLDDPTWQIITPRRARAALLRGSITAAEQPVGALSMRQPRPSLTPPSPITRIPAAAATEGAQHDPFTTPPDQAIRGEYQSQPFSITDAADRLVRASTETHNTKVAVFQAFCTAFEVTAKQFTT